MLLQLLFHPLDGVVDGFGGLLEELADLLVGEALQVQAQDLLLEGGQLLLDVPGHGLHVLPADEHLLRVADAHAREHVHEGPVRRPGLVDRLVEGHVGVERLMLLAGGALDGGQDLAGDAQLRKAAEGGVLGGVVLADGLIEAQHPLLDQVLVVRAHQEENGSARASRRQQGAPPRSSRTVPAS